LLRADVDQSVAPVDKVVTDTGPDSSSVTFTRPPFTDLPAEIAVLDPGPTVSLWLAPAREVLNPDTDLTGRLIASAIKRRDTRRLEVFSDAAVVTAVWGVVVAADAVVLDSKEDPAGLVATRYQVKPLRSWKVAVASDPIDVWALGTDGSAAHLPGDPPPREQTLSNQIYLAVGQEVLLSLGQTPLFPGDQPRLRVLGGSSGALIASGDSKTDPTSLTAFAATLDQTLVPVSKP
jgi:hypothetical protein